MQKAVGSRFLNSFADLPEGFHARVAPTPLADARNDGESASQRLDSIGQSGVDYTNLFRDMTIIVAADEQPVPALRERFVERDAFDAWPRVYRQRLRLLFSRPFDAQPEMAAYAQPPSSRGRDLVVSCSP